MARGGVERPRWRIRVRAEQYPEVPPALEVVDGLGGGLRRERQAGHEPSHFGRGVAEQQADIVPIRRQAGGRR